MKKFLCILSALIIFLPSEVFASRPVKVELNCIPMEFDQPAIVSENRTLVPLRKIFESLGASVSWDDVTRTAKAVKNDKTVSITIGTNELIVDDKVVELDVPAKIVNNRTLVPLRAISEAYDCLVLWDGEERLVDIFDQDFSESEKIDYSADNGINFTYFSDCQLIKESDDNMTVKSNNVSVTVRREPSADVLIDDTYMGEIRKGLSEFANLQLNSLEKAASKNLLLIDCHNNGNSIYYMYAYRDGFSYNLALTAPDSCNIEDLQKILYVLKTFKNKF